MADQRYDDERFKRDLEMYHAMTNRFAQSKPAVEHPTARRYRVTVWASVPLEEGENEDGTPDGVLYPQYTAKELEKHLIKVLRKAEPECDLEVMDYEDVEE